MKKIETVNIIGMGALGMLYGNIITETLGPGHVSYVMDKGRYERHKNESYKVNGIAAEFVKVPAEEARPCDLLIIAVKYPNLEETLETMKTSIGPDTILISVMNGISSEEILGERWGKDRIIHTVAQGMDAMHFGTELRFSQAGKLHMGIMDPALQPKLDLVTEFFDRAGLAYVLEEDILYRLWSKFMVNVGINQTCMVYGMNYEQAMEPGSAAYMTLIGAMREVILLANAEGIKMSEKELHQYIGILNTLDPKAIPSMAQDRVNQKPSEVELFAGTVIRMAEKHGIPVPANQFLYRQARKIEKEYI